MHGHEFQEGALVLLTLHSPRQKFFGSLLRLAAPGIELRCAPLESLEDLSRQLRQGETVAPAVVFFPMHRVERMELDSPLGEIPSLAQDFAARSGCSARDFFAGSTEAPTA